MSSEQGMRGDRDRDLKLEELREAWSLRQMAWLLMEVMIRTGVVG